MTKKAIDLGDLDTAAASDKGFELELENPVTRKALGVFITVLGRDSQAFREHTRKKVNARLRKQHNQQRRGKQEEVQTLEQIEADACELLAEVTVSWRNVTYRGEDLEFNKANAVKIYTEQPWIRAQVDEAVGDLENFMKG